MREVCNQVFKTLFRRAPLTQAAASQALRESQAVKGLEKAAWRLLAAEVLKMASEAEARADAPTHIIAVWLIALSWVHLLCEQGSMSLHPKPRPTLPIYPDA